MFDGASNVQLGDELIKYNYPKLAVIRGFEHIVNLFFNKLSQNTNVESDYYSSQFNMQLIWFWDISQASFYLQIKIL